MGSGQCIYQFAEKNMPDKFPEKNKGDSLSHQHVNALGEAFRLINLPGSGFPPWQQFAFTVTSDEGSGIYKGTVRYFNHGSAVWLDKNREWDLDANISESTLTVGDKVPAYWDGQRGMFVPVACPDVRSGGCCFVEDTFCRDDTGQAEVQAGGPAGCVAEVAKQGRLGSLWEVESGVWFIDGGKCGNVGYNFSCPPIFGDLDYFCEHCENDNPACTLRMRLSGIVNDSCEDCSDLNTNHDLTYQGNCFWQKTLDEIICGVSTIDLTLSKSGSNYILTAQAGNSVWTTDLGSNPPSCVEFNNEALAPTISDSSCDNANSTCSVSVVVTDDLDCSGPDGPHIGSNLGVDGIEKVLKLTEPSPGSELAAGDGDVAATITMTLSGIVSGDDSCDDCGILNDTFDLHYQSGNLWRHEFDDDVCNVSKIDLRLSKLSNNYILTANVGSSTWTVDLGTSKPTMVNFNDILLSPDSSDDVCDNSSSTCTISGGGFGVFLKVDSCSLIGQTRRIIVDYVDLNNYWIIEIKAGNWFSDPAAGAFRIIERSGGVETIRRDIDPAPISNFDSGNQEHNEPNLIFVCLNNDIISARIFYPEQGDPSGDPGATLETEHLDISFAMGSPAVSRFMALGSGDFENRGSRFRNFCLLKSSPDCVLCVTSCSNCEDGSIPGCWEVTLSNMTTSSPSCTHIDRYNDTFNLSPVSLTPCISDIKDACSYLECGSLRLDVIFSEDTNTYKIIVSFQHPVFRTSIWEKDYGINPPDCLAISGDSLTLIDDVDVTGDCSITATSPASGCPTDLDLWRFNCFTDFPITTPEEVLVTFTGLTGSTAQYNGSWVLDIAPEGHSQECFSFWGQTFGINVEVFLLGSGKIAFHASVFAFSGGSVFAGPTPTQFVCNDWDETDIPVFGNPPGATCKVTSL